MATTTYRILVGTDFSESANLALDSALDEAHRRTSSELHFVSVIDDGGHHLLPSVDWHTTLTQAVSRVRELLTMETGAAIARQKTGDAARLEIAPIVHVRVGGVAEQIVALATEIRADLVIVGTHGRRGVRRALMGSVADRTIRLAPCPVLVVRAKDFSAMAGLPAIDPPCPACVAVREQSHGARWWCADHQAKPDGAHVYSFSGRLNDPPSPLNHLL